MAFTNTGFAPNDGGVAVWGVKDGAVVKTFNASPGRTSQAMRASTPLIRAWLRLMYWKTAGSAGVKEPLTTSCEMKSR